MLGYQILHSHKRSGMGRLGKVQRHTAQFQTLSKLRIQYVNLLMRRRKAQSDPARHHARSKCQRTGKAASASSTDGAAGSIWAAARCSRASAGTFNCCSCAAAVARLQPVQAALDAAAAACGSRSSSGCRPPWTLPSACRAERAGCCKEHETIWIVASAWRGVTRTASST